MKDRKRSGLYQASTSLLLLFTSVSQIPFLLPKSGGSLPGNVQLAIMAWKAFAKGHFKVSHSFQKHGSQSLINPTELSVRMGAVLPVRLQDNSKDGCSPVNKEYGDEVYLHVFTTVSKKRFPLTHLFQRS